MEQPAVPMTPPDSPSQRSTSAVGRAARIRAQAPAYVLLAAVCLIVSYLFLANTAAGESPGLDGLPLDEGWQRMVYARSFGQNFSFEFNSGEATPGITSPLWAALVGVSWRLSGVPEADIVAVAKIIGILFGFGVAALVYRIAAHLTGNSRLGLLAALLLLVQPTFVFAIVSGFEVPMAAFLALCGTWAFYRGRIPLAGVAFGLLVVTRPETVVFVALSALALIARRMWQRDQLAFLDAEDFRLLAWLLGPSLALGGAFALYNFSLNGGPAPNTYYARHVDLGMLPLSNLVNALRGYYHHLPVFSGYTWLITAVVVAFGLYGVSRKRGFGIVPLTLFPLAQTYALAITFSLPSESWQFVLRRYLDTVLPFLVIGLVIGWSELWAVFRHWRTARAPADPTEVRLYNFGLNMAFVVIVALPFFALPATWGRLTGDLSWNTKNIREVPVTTALWIRDNIDPRAVIAVDSPGAIRYFTSNRLVDLTGANTHAAIGQPPLDTMRETEIEYLFAFGSVHFDSWINGIENYEVETPRNTVLPSSVMKGWLADWELNPELVDQSVPHVLDLTALGLRLVDQVDIGNPEAPAARSEKQHEYEVSGGGARVERAFKVDASGTTVKDDARTYSGFEEFVVRAIPGKRMVVAKRYDAAVAGAVRVSAGGKDVGIWVLPENRFFFGESTFTIPPDLVTTDSVRLRFTYLPRPGGLPANSFYYWILVDETVSPTG